MTIDKILEQYVGLFSGWGLRRDDYCLCGEFGLRLNGYRLKPRRRHLDFFVVARRLPWRAPEGAESTVPPSDSRAFDAFRKLLLATKSDPHLVPVPQIDITPKNLVRKSRLHPLSNGAFIRVITPIAQLGNYYSVLTCCNVRERWAEEKRLRWYRQFPRFAREARRLGDRDVVRWCKQCRLAMRSLGLNRKNGIVHPGRELSGIPVQPGRVRGRVRLIADDRSFRRVRQGEIIVMPFAKAELISVIHRAKGLITDQGGTSAHAAVISREYHLPCVIGTKIATKVLKDGDRVEVDATRGIVRKL